MEDKKDDLVVESDEGVKLSLDMTVRQMISEALTRNSQRVIYPLNLYTDSKEDVDGPNSAIIMVFDKLEGYIDALKRFEKTNDELEAKKGPSIIIT